MSEALVSSDLADGIATIALCRPDRGNAIDLDTYDALTAALVRAGRDDAVRAILITTRSPDFSVGEDFAYLGEMERAGRYGEWEQRFRGWIPVTWHNPKFVVASVRGRALGIGCELALLADVTFASETASFGHPETQHGIVRHTVWPWLVGPKLAKQYLATGHAMSATVAHQTGLINAALPDDKLDAHVQAFMADLAAMPAKTPGANKKRINWAFRDVSRVLYDDRQYDVDFDWLVASREVDQDFYRSVEKEGVRGAIQKRDSRFSDQSRR